jgi:hypothetical protein
MYTRDSFFTLSYLGQIGLAILSFMLAVCFLLLATRIARKFSSPVRLLISIAFFVLFVWLTPQVYYTYYYFLIEGLPLQWVVNAPPTPVDLGQLLTFTGPSNLSAHSKGALGWLMLILPQVAPRHSSKSHKN